MLRDRLQGAGRSDRSSLSSRDVCFADEIDREVGARGQVLHSGDAFVRRSTEQAQRARVGWCQVLKAGDDEVEAVAAGKQKKKKKKKKADVL